MKIKILICLVLCLHALSAGASGEEAADFIVFSYNRPLQLYAFLESITTYITGLENIFVLYRSSNESFEEGYRIVKHSFPQVQFVKHYGQHDFKNTFLQILDEAQAAYIMFGADDSVIKDYLDIKQTATIMQKYNAYGCFIRLSPYITNSLGHSQLPPPLQEVDEGYIWQLSTGYADWGYPHSVDGVIYRKSDIIRDIQEVPYDNPNTLEGYWASRASKVKHCMAFCYAETKTVNIPMNRIQNIVNTYHMNMPILSVESLLNLFLSGKKMDRSPLFQIKNSSPHMAYAPIFINR